MADLGARSIPPVNLVIVAPVAVCGSGPGRRRGSRMLTRPRPRSRTRSRTRMSAAVPGLVLSPRPSGAHQGLRKLNDRRSPPLGAFPGGASFQTAGGSRPSGKLPRRPTAFSRDSIAGALSGDCHPMHCPQLGVELEVTLGTMQRVARPGSAFWVLSGLGVGVGFRGRDRDSHQSQWQGPRQRQRQQTASGTVDSIRWPRRRQWRVPATLARWGISPFWVEQTPGHCPDFVEEFES